MIVNGAAGSARQQGSSGRRHTLVIVLDLAARAAARTRRFGFAFILAYVADRTDRGRQEIGDTATNLLLGDRGLGLLLVTRAALGALTPGPVFTRLAIFARLTLFARAIVTRAIVTRALLTRLTIFTRTVITIAIAAFITIAARLTLAILALRPLLPRLVERFLVALALEAFVLALVLIVLRRALILESRTSLTQHTEIMIRELQIIFGLHTVPGELRVAGHVLVLFEKLRGITAAALIAATAAASAETSRLLTPTTATAAALAIVHQA